MAKRHQKTEGEFSLRERLALIPDFRRGEGKMHGLVDILLMVIMAFMSGITGQRALGDFVKKNQKELKKFLRPRNGKLPSRQTIGRVLQNISFEEFSKQFRLWACSVLGKNPDEWISPDGKAIRGTVKHAHGQQQQMTQLVSAFLQEQKQVLGAHRIHQKDSEIPAVKDLLKMLKLQEKVFRLDALHCQKQTTKVIKESGNEYVLQVKGNQPKLQKHVEKKDRPK